MNEQNKAPADFVRAHTQKYVTEQKRKGNEVMRSSDEAETKNAPKKSTRSLTKGGIFMLISMI